MNWYVRSALWVVFWLIATMALYFVFGYLATPEGLRP